MLTERWNQLNSNYLYWIDGVRKRNYVLQQNIFSKQKDLDETFPANLKKSKNRKQAEQMMNQFTDDLYKEILSVRPKK